MKKVVFAYFSKSSEIEGLIKRLEKISPNEFFSFDLRGKDVPSFDEDTIILPLLVQKGGLWKSLNKSRATVLPPLLGTDDDLELIATSIEKALPPLLDTSYLLVAHGDEKEDIKEYEKLQSLLREDIFIMSLKGKREFPLMKEKVVVLPFLLSFGHHAKLDIANEIMPKLKEMGRDAKLIEAGAITYIDAVEEIFISRLISSLSSY